MSKLADRIRRVSRTAPAPLGFTAAAATPQQPTMLCLVRLSGPDGGKAAEAGARGADGVIVDGLDAGRAPELVARAKGVIVGARLGRAGRPEAAALRQAGVDFLVVDSAAAAEVMLEEGLGFVMALGKDADDATLRLLGDLSLDALLLGAQEAPMTVGRLLEVRRLAALARTPLLVEVTAGAEAAHLQVLRDSGAVGVVADGSALGRLEALRRTIASLPARRRRREERAEAVLPVQLMTEHEEAEEEEEGRRQRAIR